MARSPPSSGRYLGDVGCPVHEDFDPLCAEFLADPYAVMAALPRRTQPVFYAPSLDYYVVTRYADVEAVFLDPETFSAATAQLPLVALVPEALKILAEGGHRPQPSMVSLDPPAHTRLRRPTSRAFTPRRVAAMEPRIRATVDELLDAVDAQRAVRPRRRRSPSRCPRRSSSRSWASPSRTGRS